MTDILPRLQEFWNEANQSNSVNHKLAVIAKLSLLILGFSKITVNKEKSDND